MLTMSEVTYKKGNAMRYTLWGMAAALVLVMMVTFFNMVNAEVSASVPDGYKFAVTESYAEGSGIKTTYYVYEDKVLVEDMNTQGGNGDRVDRTVMIYDDINTQGLRLDADDKTEMCSAGVCREQPKVLMTLKSLLQRKVGRQYIGL